MRSARLSEPRKTSWMPRRTSSPVSLWLLWQGIRLPTFLLLAILEPVVRLVLGSLALLGVLTAFFWRLVGPPHFPFLLVLGVSLGFELVLIIYRKLLGVLSP